MMTRHRTDHAHGSAPAVSNGKYQDDINTTVGGLNSVQCLGQSQTRSRLRCFGSRPRMRRRGPRDNQTLNDRIPVIAWCMRGAIRSRRKKR